MTGMVSFLRLLDHIHWRCTVRP